MTALVIAAHPDDEILGCGGTMARLRSQGRDVHVHILAEGLRARTEADGADLGDLRASSRRALAELSVEKVTHHDFPDNRMDRVELLEVAKVVESIVEAVNPTTVYTHHPGDLNVDHRVTAQAVITATRPTPESSVKEVLSWEVASSTEWAFFRTGPSFEPNVFIEITDHMDAKLRALAHYGDEIKPFPHARSLEGLRAIAEVRGSAVGVPAAEAFALLRSVHKQSEIR